MPIVPSLQLIRRSIASHRQDASSKAPIDQLVELGSWMVVLGTIRAICSFADLVGAFVEAWRLDSLTFAALGTLTGDHQPIIELLAAWPLFLAFALRRKQWPELLPAAAATFLILSMGGVVALSAQLPHASADGLTVGSFHLTRRAFEHPTISDASLGVLGVTQLLLEFATAVRAILLVPRFRGVTTADPGQTDRARRTRFGRLALYTSLVFLVLIIRLPIWSTYLGALNNSRIFRDFVLRIDPKPARRPRNFVSASKEETRIRETRMRLNVAHREVAMEHFRTGAANYTRIIAFIDSLTGAFRRSEYRFLMAEALNNLAWLEATCPELSVRNPTDAVLHARRAVRLQEKEGIYWNTLGAAYYRDGEWRSAKDALVRSLELRDGGDSSDWFLLAMVGLKLGDKEEAREWYDRAVAWFHRSRPNDPELYRFQVEAAELLGLEEPEPPPVSPAAKARSAPLLRYRSSALEERNGAPTADSAPKPLSK
jgi:tetratricopeptide (TPR) repeat protein